jgi:hypothetical protein
MALHHHDSCGVFRVRPVRTDFRLLVFTAALFGGGCGHATNPQATASLAGTVTLDRQPLESGRIQFLPRQAGQPDGAEIEAGHYSAAQVPLGPVRVVFTAVKETGRMIQEGGHTFPDRVNLIPTSYQAGIEIQVTGNKDDQDFALVSKQASLPPK